MDVISLSLDNKKHLFSSSSKEECIREDRSASDELTFQGELKLLKGNLTQGLELFDTASHLNPLDPMLLYRQGLALFEYGNEEGKEKTLLLALKKLKKAISLDPNFLSALHILGNVLISVGKALENQSYFLEAEKYLLKALDLCDPSHQKDLISDLYWDHGVVWTYIAQYSGEAVDLQQAILSFQKATDYFSERPSEFWIDFGKAHLQLTKITHDPRSCTKALHYFKYAVNHTDSSYEAWELLAQTMETLYQYTHDDDHATQANECYRMATQLQPTEAMLWLAWARLLCDTGRRQRDVKQIRASIEKCHRAHACDPKEALSMAIWGEALSLLGEFTDRLDLMTEAQNKVSEALDLSEDDPEIWYSYGMCLYGFGQYFNDFDYYYQAIEKFQAGLSIDRTHHRLWHALGLSYHTVGLLESDADALEKSLKFYRKALLLFPSNFTLFEHALALSRLGDTTQNEYFLEQACKEFESVLSLQKNALYIHPQWLFHYATTLDTLGDFHEEESYYVKAIEIFSHVLMIDPDYPRIHHHLAQTYSHLGDLLTEPDHFYRALHHLRLAAKHEEEDDQILLDWGVVLIHIAQYCHDPIEMDQTYREAEHKLMLAAKLGNQNSLYQLGCLHSILKDYEKALSFILKAHESKVLPSVDEILNDEWLDGLRSTTDFREFIVKLENHPNIHEEK